MLTLDVTRAKSIRLGWGTGAEGWRGLFFRLSESLLTLERGAKIPGEGQTNHFVSHLEQTRKQDLSCKLRKNRKT